MAARQPFWKRYHWKLKGFGPWPQTTCIWNVKFEFQSQLELHSGNHATYRVQILKNPCLPGGHFESNIAENPMHTSDVPVKFGLDIQSQTKVKTNRLLSIATNNMHVKFEIEIPKQTWVMLQKPCCLQTDEWTRCIQYAPPPPPPPYTHTHNHEAVISEQRELEQLERLHSEIPPTAPRLPILVVHITSQVKTRQSQSYKFKKNAKNSARNFIHNTPSEIAW